LSNAITIYLHHHSALEEPVAQKQRHIKNPTLFKKGLFGTVANQVAAGY